MGSKSSPSVALFALLLTALFVSGCDDPPPPKATAPAPAASTVSGKSGATAAASSTGRTNVSTADDSFAAMPPGAMLYLAARPELLDHVMAAMPPEDRESTTRDLKKLLGGPADAAALVSELSLDPERPVLLAIVPAPGEGVAKIVADLMGAGSADDNARKAAVERAAKLSPPVVSLARLQLPLASFDTDALIAVLERALSAKADKCSISPACALLHGEPIALLTGKVTALVFLRNKKLVVDIARAYFNEPGDPVVLSALDRFRESKGGPGDKCKTSVTTITSVAAHLCVLPDTAADYGWSSGFAAALSAVNAQSITAGQAAAILDTGKREAAHARRVAERKPVGLDHGSITLRGMPGAPKLDGSWLVRTEPRPKLTETFAKERCAKSADGIGKLLSDLASALPAGAPFKRDRRAETALIDEVWRGGWATWPVIAGRGWPTFLPIVLNHGDDPSLVVGGQMCVRYQGGWLRVTATPDLAALHRK